MPIHLCTSVWCSQRTMEERGNLLLQAVTHNYTFIYMCLLLHQYLTHDFAPFPLGQDFVLCQYQYLLKAPKLNKFTIKFYLTKDMIPLSALTKDDYS